MNGLIQPEMTVKELLQKWPAAIPVFFQHKMACVGCSMAPYDTLAQVAATYNLEFNQFFTELALAIQGGLPGVPPERMTL